MLEKLLTTYPEYFLEKADGKFLNFRSYNILSADLIFLLSIFFLNIEVPTKIPALYLPIGSPCPIKNRFAFPLLLRSHFQR